MSVPTVKFNTQEKKEFFDELKKRVDAYFTDNNISKNANLNMKLKTAFMLLLQFVPLVILLTNTVHNTAAILSLWGLMGFGTAGIGLSIMHDANHGSYSKNKNTNTALGLLFNVIGSYYINWKIQHNVLHHTYTNIEGFDEDIDTRVMRLSPKQERLWAHRFQAYYASFFYGIMTIYWLVSKDFEQLVKYNKLNLFKSQGVTYSRALFQIILTKVLYFSVVIGLPLLVTDMSVGVVLLGFFIMHFICGVTLSFIFQCAHVLEETEFFEAEKDHKQENSWAIHQLKTTANFANKSRVFSWLIGGLNFQVEHHLFPNICHVHYRNIAPIIKKTAQEFELPYNEHHTFVGALNSHFSLLNHLGRA
ncbi:acyl-CoA desaturase [Cyclobacteriaceae bacterium]|nr:acyl-CoA desaturase [Cyclobacteriaceae bacterium]